MKKHLLTTGFFSFLLMLFGSTAIAQVTTLTSKKTPAAVFDAFLQKQIDSLGMPALSIAIINNGRISYHKALGVANMDTKVKVDEQSVFEAASMSKPVFAYLVMRMVDKGLL